MPALQNGHNLKTAGMNSMLNQNPNWLELAQQANWSVSALAKKCGVSVRTVERYFIKMMGKTPHVWLSEQRHRHANELLRNGRSIKETANRLGYKYPTNFTRNYKSCMGSCPTKTVSCHNGAFR
jgi:AraC-like DNA-binding protein